MMMNDSRQIPKIIHYCWFGGKEKPEFVEKCIASWKKFLPDYELKEWNETNFDVNIVPYTKQGYELKKYSFITDYVRYWVLYEYGGIYLDTDVEIVKPMDEILSKISFIGREDLKIKPSVNSGLGMGAIKGLPVMKDFMEIMGRVEAILPDGTINPKIQVDYMTEYLLAKGLKKHNKIQTINDLIIYPKEYFCPDYLGDGKYKLTKNTYSIHHYAASWVDDVRNFWILNLPFGIQLKFYICKEETKKTNTLPANEKEIIKFNKNKRRYIVITFVKNNQ